MRRIPAVAILALSIASVAAPAVHADSCAEGVGIVEHWTAFPKEQGTEQRARIGELLHEFTEGMRELSPDGLVDRIVSENADGTWFIVNLWRSQKDMEGVNSNFGSLRHYKDAFAEFSAMVETERTFGSLKFSEVRCAEN